MTFDLDQYLATKVSPTIVDEKLAQVEAATAANVAKLQAISATSTPKVDPNPAAWSNKLGLEPTTFLANRVNDIASLASGTSRLAGQIASLPVNALAMSVTLKATPADYEAYNRAMQGKATDEDKLLLNRPISPESSRTILSGFRDAEKLRNTSRDINNFTDLSKIVEQTNRNQLNHDLGDEFQSNWDKVTGGWDAGKHGNFAQGAGKIVSGMAGLMLNAGEAVVTNPSAAREYIVENAPQLFVGALGKTGQAAMAASNMGYAADYYQQGIEKYAKDNGGQLPPEAQRQRMAVLSASLALAEHAGDHASLAFMKHGADDLATGFAAGLRRTAGAAAEGFASEAATEGYQTWAEGEVSGIPATAQDIYTGAIIGGVAGAGLTGGGHAVAEAIGATPAAEAKTVEAANTKQTFEDAVVNNDISTYTDPKSENYDLAKGMGALVANSMRDDSTPETKQANLKQAGELLSQLEDQHEKAKNEADTFSPNSVAEAKAKVALYEEELSKVEPGNTTRIAELTDLKDGWTEVLADATDSKAAEKARTVLSKLDRQVETGRTYMSNLANLHEKAATPEEITTLVDQVSKKANPAVDTQGSADRLINLSMTQPEALPAKTALALSEDKTNSLNDEQRAHLRVFSDARIAENNLSTQSKVSQEVLYGSDKNVGLTQYRSRIATAITANNPDTATRQLNQLEQFTVNHEDKAATARQALTDYGMGAQIVYSAANKKWEAHDRGTFTDKQLRQNGGLALNSGRLVQDMKNEAVALRAGYAEMKSATAVKFGVQSESSTQDTVPPGNINSPKNEEDTARPVVPTEPLTAQATPSPKKKGTTFEEGQAKIARQEEAVRKAEESLAARKQAKAAAVEQPAVVSEANPAPVAETATPEVGVTKEEKTTTLKVFDTEHKTDVPYQEQNLVGVHFKQSPGSETGTQRPLAKVRDFVSSLKNKTSKISDFVNLEGQPSDEQRKVVQTFVSTANAWKDIITNNLVKGNAGYGHEDLMQFLINEKGDLDENVKTAIAYAAFSWVAENAARPDINTREEINIILNRGEDALVSTAERNALENVGTRQNVMVNSLGQRIVASLGLKSLASAPRNLQADLESSLGAHAMKLLMDEGILVRSTVTGQEMAALTKSENTSANAKFYFLKLARTEAGLNEKAEAIFQANKGTQGIIDKLFGVEPALKEPSTVPVKATQKTTRNTSMAIPSELEKQVAKDNAEASYVRADMYNLAGQMDPEILLQIAGKENIDSSVHKSRRKSLQAKNDGLARELDRFMGYVGQVGADAAMYFEHSVWMQQRVGIATNMINPQTSKIHRHMLYRAPWESKIAFNDADAMTNFKLRVAEGLGVKTDKKSKDKALSDFTAILAKPEIKGAVAVLVKSLQGPENGSLSENDQQILLAGVKAGKEEMHSLDALMALAQMTLAKKEGNTKFTTHMMAEVDGVTNGPMLSHLLLGAADTVKGMFSLLNRGGFFEQGNAHTEYNNWRDAPGNFDLYENTALHMTQAINAAGFDAGSMSSIYAFTGELADSKGVTSAGRNIIKTPLTAMVFGSSVNNAVDSMADNFVDAIYQTIEGGKMDSKDIIQHLADLGVRVPASVDLMEHEFSPLDVSTLKGVFTETLGAAVAETMKQDFEVFITQRTEFNKTAQLTFEVYNAVYQGLREELVAQLIADGKMAVNKTTGLPIHDLTNAQEKELRKQVEALAPVMNTPMSKASNDLKSGIMVAKTARKLSTSDMYKNTVKFAQPFKDNNSKSTTVHGYEVTPTGPGVAMVPVSMHSADSAISVRANQDGKALNIHDAQGHGVNGIVDTARKMNEATWNTMLNYSPASEVRDALLRTVHGLTGLMEAGKVSDVVLSKLASSLVDFAEKHDVAPEGVLFLQAELAQNMAYRADSMKLDTMAEMQAVNQYAMEGGAFAVESSHRSSAASLRSALEVAVSDADRSALTLVSDKLAAAIKKEMAKRDPEAQSQADPEMDKAKPVSDVAELGKSAIPSDPKLVTAFEKNPSMAFSDAVTLLQGMAKGDFQTKLLGQLARVVGDDLKINYVTPSTAVATLLAKGGDTSRGWYASKGNQHEVNVLSPDFKYSGLTVELLLHELTHAALARTIDEAQRTGTGPAFELVNDLETLRNKAAALVESNGLTKEFGAATADVQELVAWGMNNQAFQDKVLRSVNMESTTLTTGNKLMDGMKMFAKSLIKMLFGRTNDGMADGITVLITNVSGLFNAAAKKTKQVGNPLVLNMAATVRDLSTQDIYDALTQSNNGATVTTEHSEHLQGLLKSLVSAVYGPFGSFKESMMKQTAQDPIDVYTEALRTGEAPFASESLAAGFAFTNQEAFVLEQVEATVRTALESNDGVMTIAYKELTRLYSEVRAKLTVESFHSGDWTTATQIEKDSAKALYDFVFDIKQAPSGKSDYISRFAALGLVHSGFREQLKFDTALVSTATNLSFNERLNKIFNTIMSWVAGKMTDTFRGQRADNKLTALVQQMIQIEAKKRNRVTSGAQQTLNSIQSTAEDMSESVRKSVEEFGKKPFFKESGSAFIKAGGGLLSAVAGDRVDGMMEAYMRLRDKTMTGQLGVAASLVNEIRGATSVNQVYHYLLRGTKHIEGIRKDTISNISKAVTTSFANQGEDLTDEHKKALTAVVLRGDMQSLLGQYTVSQLQNLVSDPVALQTEITAHESQLTGKMNRFYKTSAKALGYFMATSKITVAHQLFNAGNIARVYGTGMSNRVTEVEAKAATPVIDRLASLYAIKYSSRSDIKMLNEVFSTEAARTDGGHGIEMIMKTHTALQAESKDKLFADSEALMMKGFVPEVYDPYMSVVMATDDEGIDLIKRGYVPMPGHLGQDSADPFTDRKRIYSLRDGGMKQWNSGIVSTTDSRAKGSKVVNGKAQPVSVAGQQNISAMASIRAGKRAGIQSMFTSPAFDPTQVHDTHMAPVLNPNGDVTNYRYMMSNRVKDKLLNRDNRTDHLLGAMAGNTFDKVASGVQNSNAIKAMHAQYRADFAEHPESYLTVGPTSSDPQLREIWDMLPRAAQQEAKALFGKDGLKVRNDVLDINFGYRKLSLGSVFDKEHEQRNFAERMFVEIMDHAFKEKAQLRTRQAEDIWQAIVKETKANLVVKSWSTMSGNLRSNWSQLFLMGVSPMAILNGHRVAFKSAWEYKQDSAKLFSLKHQQKIGHYEPGVTAVNAAYQVKRLEDSLARNPIRPLIDAGLMPTIVEDVSVDEDIYSYKSRFTEKIDSTIDNVNPHILKATRLLTMHHSTAPYKVMSYATQISDFLARYTLYQHDIKTMAHEQAVQRASEAFINYDVPTHRKIQYANDTGLIMFSKYYVRIQKVLGRIYKDAPGRVLALLAAEHMIGDQPTVLDSGFTHKFGNPFNMGALDYVGSLDSVTTVGLLISPFTTAVYNGQ